MPTKRYAILAVVLTLVLAGCAGIGGLGGPSVSNAEATVVEEESAIVFDYDIDDYAIAMLEDPDGNVVHENRIEPSQNSSGLLIGETQAGEYRLLIRQGGETVASETLKFDGPGLEISSVEDNWSGNSIESVRVTVENRGDLPARLEGASYEVDGNEESEHLYQAVGAGETETIEITPAFGGAQFEEPGQMEGSVFLETTDADLSDRFTRVLEPASLSVETVEPQWSGNELEQVNVNVRNTGDVPTSANVDVEHQGEEVAGTRNRSIDPGQNTEFEVRPSWTSFEVESGGEAQFDLYVNSPEGQVQDGFERDIQGADVSLESVESTWEYGELNSVEFSADNAGEVDAEYDATLEVNGDTLKQGQVTISSDGTSEQTFIEDSIYSSLDYRAETGGTYDVTLTIETDEGPIEATDTVEFEGIDYTVSDVDTTFFDSFDTDESELSSVSFSVRNDGDISLPYDAVEVELDGASRTDEAYSTVYIDPGASSSEYVRISDDIVVDEGSHDLTIRLVLDGDTVASETTTVTAE